MHAELASHKILFRIKDLRGMRIEVIDMEHQYGVFHDVKIIYF
jgi:hypothetical protein